MMLPGEEDAIKLVLATAEVYGYGNLIGHLKSAWAHKLMESNPRHDWESAVRATNVSEYPENWFRDLYRGE